MGPAGGVGELHPAAGDAAAREVEQARDGQGGHRLARAGLAHQRQGLALGHREVERVDNPDRAGFAGKRDLQPGHPQKRLHARSEAATTRGSRLVMRQANTPDRSDQYVLALHGLSLLGHAAVVAHCRCEAVRAVHDLDLGALTQVVWTHAAQLGGK